MKSYMTTAKKQWATFNKAGEMTSNPTKKQIDEFNKQFSTTVPVDNSESTDRKDYWMSAKAWAGAMMTAPTKPDTIKAKKARLRK